MNKRGRGRPKGVTKDSNRPRIRNHNGRIIDINGPQYNKLIKNGYKHNFDNTQLIIDEGFIGERFVKRSIGRPKKLNRPLPSNEKVLNPKTFREILIGGQTFKQLLHEYKIDENTKPFVAFVKDPKNLEKNFVINDETFKKYIDRGYIYNEKKNKLNIPSIKSEKAFGKAAVTHDLKVVNKDDPEIQMKKLNDRIIFLLNKFFKKLNGIKFNICFDITFSKLTNKGEEVIERFSFRSLAKEITHESDIFSSIHSQKMITFEECVMDLMLGGLVGLLIEFG